MYQIHALLSLHCRVQAVQRRNHRPFNLSAVDTPLRSFWLPIIPVWPGRWVRRHCDQQSNPAAPGRSPSQLLGRLCRASCHCWWGSIAAPPIPFTAATPGCSTTQLEVVRRRGLGGTHFAMSSPLPMYTAALSSLVIVAICLASSPVQPRGIRTIEFSQAAVHGRQLLFPL